jgi:hypothetical protein
MVWRLCALFVASASIGCQPSPRPSEKALGAIQSATSQATRELTLEAYLGKDLRKLDDVSRQEFRSRFEMLTGDKPVTDSPRPFTAWWVQPFVSGDTAWILLEAYRGYDVPDVSAVQVHLFDRNWKRLIKQPFPTGYRLFLEDVALSKENPLKEYLLVVRVTSSGPFIVQGDQKRPAFEQGDFQRQFYGVVSGQIMMVRMEDDQGHPVRNAYRWSTPMKGPPPPKRTPEEWIGALRSTSVAEQLATLIWLSGAHLPTVEPRSENVSQESVAESKVFETVRDAKETKELLRELLTSTNPWVQEYARLASEQQ